MRSNSESLQGPDASAGDALESSTHAPLILALDTATDMRSVAITRGKRLLTISGGRVQRENTASVLQDIDEALAASGLKLGDIELFAVATGPGSFTGLRSGIATVKAFAATLNRPVAGVPTLHAVAFACGTSPRILASLPAGRGEVFAQLLSVDGENAIRELSEPSHLSPAALLEKAAEWGGDFVWAGAGAHAHVALIREFAGDKKIIWRDEVAPEEVALEDELKTGETSVVWKLAPSFESYAAQIAALGLINNRQGSTIVAEDLHALYVRLSDAELNEKCRR